MSLAEGFIKLPRSILGYLERGEIGYTAYGVYIVTLLQADVRTGIWFGSSTKLRCELSLDVPGERQLKRALECLEKSGLIKRFITPGKRRNYPVLIDGFEVRGSALRRMRLNASKSKDWKEPVYEVCTDESSNCP